MTRVAVVVGNPKANSRTLAAAVGLADRLVGGSADVVVDLALLGPAVLDPDDTRVAALVDQVRQSDLVVVASPTYHGTFTGLLKSFLDRVPYKGLTGQVAVPVMLGAGAGHGLAPDLFLRQVLVELGAAVPAPGLFVLEAAYDAPATYDAWLETHGPQVHAALAIPATVAASA